MEDLLERYKELKNSHRIFVVIAMALFYPIYDWDDQEAELSERLEMAQQNYESQNATFLKNQKKVRTLPDLSARESEITSKMTNAKKYLPTNIKFDEILATLGSYERDLDVKMARFSPGREMESGGQANYKRVPVQMNLEGEFGKVMLFLDQLVHLKSLVHIKSLEIDRHSKDKDAASKPDNDSSFDINPAGKVIAKVGLMFFRSPEFK